MDDEISTLKEGESHPSTHIAKEYVTDFISRNNMFLIMEAMASTALSGNRHAAICHETLQRMVIKEPVSDRYLMGLAWYFYAFDKQKISTKKKKK